MHDIAVFNDVILAFKTPFSGVFSALLAFVGDEVFIRDDFGADEASFKVAMDNAGGLWRRCSYGNGPGPDFLDAGGKISR